MYDTMISEVVFYPIRPTPSGLIGFGACVFDNSLSLNGIAIYTRLNGKGIRCLFPAKTLPNGKEISLFYPISKEVGEEIQEAFNKKLEELAKKVEGKNGYDEQKRFF